MSVLLANAMPQTSFAPEETVTRIHGGKDELRSPFIEQYQPFIASVTARLINAPAQGRDEYAVALEAFNEAIDRFDPSRGRSFLSFCELVINHRVVDYLRSNHKHAAAYPFTYYEAAGNSDVVDRAVRQNPSMLTDHIEIREEIEAFRERLASFGIKLTDLVNAAPRHIDSKVMCAMIARALAGSPELSDKLEKTKQIPIAQLLERARVGRKAVENNRKYIIALYIVLTSGMEIIKSYVGFMQEGVSGK